MEPESSLFTAFKAPGAACGQGHSYQILYWIEIKQSNIFEILQMQTVELKKRNKERLSPDCQVRGSGMKRSA